MRAAYRAAAYINARVCTDRRNTLVIWRITPSAACKSLRVCTTKERVVAGGRRSEKNIAIRADKIARHQVTRNRLRGK